MFRDSVFSLITTVVRLATGVVLFVVLAHVWGPERFGVFMYPFTIAGILVKVVDFGFVLQVARDVGRRPTDAHATMSRALGAKLILVAPATAAAFAVAVLLPGSNGFGALLALLVVDAMSNSFTQFLNIPLRALGRFDEEARIAAIGSASVFAAVVAVAVAGHGPLIAAGVMAGCRAICLLLSLNAYRRVLGSSPHPVIERQSLRTSLWVGLPFGVHATVATLNMQVDTLMVQHFLGAPFVGLYQAGMRILLGALLVGDALNSVYLSAMARASHDRQELSRLGQRMTRQLLTVGLFAFGCIIAAGPWVVRLLFGGRYEALSPLLPLFGLLAFVRYGGVSYGTLLTLADRQAVRVAAVCGVMVLGLALNALLIPRFGLTGAISSAILGHLVLYAVYVTAARKDVGGFLLDRRAGILLCLGIAIVLCLPLLPSVDASVRIALGATLALASLVVGPTAAEWGRLPRPLRPVAPIAR
ncbi:MAG TPA: oligosaccharide flippase family protein [Gemmatimonadaceae bacterium]|nr:oligosaccharide flippase family protein [Gemmatimonadaceae bacterium]